MDLWNLKYRVAIFSGSLITQQWIIVSIQILLLTQLNLTRRLTKREQMFYPPLGNPINYTWFNPILAMRLLLNIKAFSQRQVCCKLSSFTQADIILISETIKDRRKPLS